VLVTLEGVVFPGAAAPLTGELAYAADGRPSAATAVAGPHPHMGGTMGNRLVCAIAQQLAESGFVSLRFDYAPAPGGAGGLAESLAAFWQTGHAPHDAQRAADAYAAARFLGTLGPWPLMLVGYSFGAHAVWEVCRGGNVDVAALVLISPTLTRHPFDRPSGAHGPELMVLYSDNDFATPASAVESWVRAAPTPPRCVRRDGGDHFFRGQEAEVAALVAAFLREVRDGLSCAGRVSC
jgi:alpha/beta superfamily hydrolase